jgi:hypothetical protein
MLTLRLHANTHTLFHSSISHIVCHYAAGEFDAMLMLGQCAPAPTKRKHITTGRKSTTAMTVKRNKLFPTVEQVHAEAAVVNARMLNVIASTLFQLNCSQENLTELAAGIASGEVHAGEAPSSTTLHTLACERSVLMDKKLSSNFGSKVRVHSFGLRCFLLPLFF